MKNPKPNLFIVGFPRSGTTSLHNYLSKHKDIQMSRIKEIAFFSKDFIKNKYVLDNWPCPKTNKEYLSFFKKSKKRYFGESTPFYIFSNVAASEIYSHNPNSKIIIIIREPLDFLCSMYAWGATKGYEREKNFFDFLNRPVKMKSNSINFKETVFMRTNYSLYIKRFIKYFPKKNIKIILYDNLKKNPLETYKELLVFLNLPFKKISFKIYNKSHVPKYFNHNKFRSGLKMQLRKKLKPYVIDSDNLLFRKGFIKESLIKQWSY